MSNQKHRSKVVEQLTSRAVERYGELKNRKARPPLNELILALFYEFTSVRRGTRALNELKRAFVDWNEVRVSHPAEVAGVLSSARWAVDSAEQIVWLLQELHGTRHRVDLDFVHDLTPTQARSAIKGLPIVKRHMADDVLLMSLFVPVLPCSSYTARMAHRLGLTDDDRPLVKNQRALQAQIESELFPPVHLLFCDYAELCTPEEPDCENCVLGDLCPNH